MTEKTLVPPRQPIKPATSPWSLLAGAMLAVTQWLFFSACFWGFSARPSEPLNIIIIAVLAAITGGIVWRSHFYDGLGVAARYAAVGVAVIAFPPFWLGLWPHTALMVGLFAAYSWLTTRAFYRRATGNNRHIAGFWTREHEKV